MKGSISQVRANGERQQSGRDRPHGEWPRVYAIGLLLGVSSAVVGIPYGFVELRLWHLLLVAAAILAFASSLSRGLKSVHLFAHDFTATIFVAWGLVVEYVNSSDLSYPFRPVNAIVGSLFLLAYWTVRLSVNTHQDAVNFLRGFVLPAIPVALLAAAQSGSAGVSRWVLLVAPSEGLSNRLEDGRLIRATGLIGHWTGLGFYFCAMLAASLVLTFIRRGRSRSVIGITGAASSLIGVFSSLTLAAILTSGAILLSAIVLRGRTLGPFIGVVAAISVIWFYFRDLLGDRIEQQLAARPEWVPAWIPNTIAFRMKIWTEQSIPVASERPFWGWGSGLFSADRQRPYQLSWPSAESQWFAQMLSAGVVSMVLLAALIAAMLYSGIKLSRDYSYGRGVYPFIALVIMTFASSFTAPVYINRGLTIPLWILFGLVCALRCIYEGKAANISTSLDRAGNISRALDQH